LFVIPKRAYRGSRLPALIVFIHPPAPFLLLTLNALLFVIPERTYRGSSLLAFIFLIHPPVPLPSPGISQEKEGGLRGMDEEG